MLARHELVVLEGLRRNDDDAVVRNPIGAQLIHRPLRDVGIGEQPVDRAHDFDSPAFISQMAMIGTNFAKSV